MLSLSFRSQYGPGQKEETDQPHTLDVKYPQGLGHDPSGGRYRVRLQPYQPVPGGS